MSGGGWIGVDLDGTLAFYDPVAPWDGSVGAPIEPMVARVRDWLNHGIEVRIMTARVSGGDARADVAEQRAIIGAWCLKHFGRVLPITCKKDYQMIELWDDRCVQVIPNTGIAIQDHLHGVSQR